MSAVCKHCHLPISRDRRIRAQKHNYEDAKYCTQACAKRAASLRWWNRTGKKNRAKRQRIARQRKAIRKQLVKEHRL